MLPVVKGLRTTRRAILIYTLLLFLVSCAPYFMGLCGPFYLACALVLNAGFVFMALRVLNDPQTETGESLTGDAPARRAFRYSLLYLFLLFLALIADKAFS